MPQTSISVYAPQVLEVVAVASEVSRFLEQQPSRLSRYDLCTRLSKLLPLLYLKTAMLPLPASQPEDDEDADALEHFVSEFDYDAVRDALFATLADADGFLFIAAADEQWSDTPNVASLSEMLADVYQDLKDFSLRYELGSEAVMLAALREFRRTFAEIWGERLLASLSALHRLVYADLLPEASEPEDDAAPHACAGDCDDDACSCDHHHHHHDDDEACTCGHHTHHHHTSTPTPHHP